MRQRTLLTVRVLRQRYTVQVYTVIRWVWLSLERSQYL